MEEMPLPGPRANMKLYLIRHAKTIDSEEGKSQSPDAIIDETSVEKGLYSDLKVDKVYCSPLVRATRTADLLFGKGNYEIVDYIYEYIRPKFLDGKSREEARKFWDWGLLEYRKDPNWKYDGSESFNEIKARAEKFLKFLKKQKERYNRVAVVGPAIFFRHLLGVIAAGKKYDQLIFLDLARYIDWAPLEMKEIEI
jgi:broad specificity phosphatase PhoE